MHVCIYTHMYIYVHIYTHACIYVGIFGKANIQVQTIRLPSPSDALSLHLVDVLIRCQLAIKAPPQRHECPHSCPPPHTGGCIMHCLGHCLAQRLWIYSAMSAHLHPTLSTLNNGMFNFALTKFVGKTVGHLRTVCHEACPLLDWAPCVWCFQAKSALVKGDIKDTRPLEHCGHLGFIP